MNITESKILIDSTYKELSRIKQDVDVFSASQAFKQNVLSIEVALALFQMGLLAKRPILEHEEHWFQGGYLIHYDFDGRWEKLADNYSQIADFCKKSEFFR